MNEKGMISIKICDDFINLNQFLKLINVITNGGMGKQYILTHTIKVNDELEQRRGRKLRVGDQIEIEDKTYVIQRKND